jgi:TonB family protein
LTDSLGFVSRTTSDDRIKLASTKRLFKPTLPRLALLVFCLALSSDPAVEAQSGEQNSRRVIKSEKPNYPAVLKNKGIGGVVRLNAFVLAKGTVGHVAIVGGNPILAASAVNAVMKWKYTPAASASTEFVTFNFNPH